MFTWSKQLSLKISNLYDILNVKKRTSEALIFGKITNFSLNMEFSMNNNIPSLAGV